MRLNYTEAVAIIASQVRAAQLHRGRRPHRQPGTCGSTAPRLSPSSGTIDVRNKDIDVCFILARQALHAPYCRQMSKSHEIMYVWSFAAITQIITEKIAILFVTSRRTSECTCTFMLCEHLIITRCAARDVICSAAGARAGAGWQVQRR